MIVAVDVDGTLYDGIGVAAEAVTALAEAGADGHTIVISTGRPWRDLPGIIGDVLPIATAAVCEEGTVLVDLASGRRTFLAEPIDRAIAAELTAAGVAGVVLGEVMISAPVAAIDAFRPYERDGIRLVVNKGSVALSPAGCDKATGLRMAIDSLGLDGEALMAIGDAENDLPMFAIADIAVAVAGADDAVRAAGIERTAGGCGQGVAEALRRHLPPGGAR